MKKTLFSFLALALVALSAHPTPARATTSSATSVRILFSSGATCTNCGNLGTSTWVDLVASTSKAIKGVDIINTSLVPLQLAVGASSAEAVQLIIPAGDQQNPMGIMNQAQPHFYPIAISQGQKVSIRALNSSAVGNEVNANFYYY